MTRKVALGSAAAAAATIAICATQSGCVESDPVSYKDSVPQDDKESSSSKRTTASPTADRGTDASRTLRRQGTERPSHRSYRITYGDDSDISRRYSSSGRRLRHSPDSEKGIFAQIKSIIQYIRKILEIIIMSMFGMIY